MTLLLSIFLIAHFPISSVLVSPSQVTITKVATPGDPSDEKWVAKRQGKILWSYPALGSKVYDSHSGVTVLGSEDLMLVDHAGTIKKRLMLGAVNDPRTSFLEGRYLVYDTGALAVAHYDPKSDGLLLWGWLKDVRRLHVYDVASSHPLWQAAELSVGLPIACNGNKLETVRIVNFARCLQRPRTSPQVVIRELDMRTGKAQRQAGLSLTRSEGKDIFSHSLGIEPIGVSRVHWTATKVLVERLFGRNYIGHRIGRRLARAGQPAT